MSVTIERVSTRAQFQQFRDLQNVYEESLPEDLRHDRAVVADIEAIYSAPNAAFLAVIDEYVAGCIAVTSLDATTDIMQRLYVDPAFRKHGAGVALVHAALDFSRINGRVRMVLDTDRERLNAAYRLYLSLGFRECEPYGPVDYRCPTYMELLLSRE